MSLENLERKGRLARYDPDRDEIQYLLEIVDRDLNTCRSPELDPDWRFAMAYNAALQVANAALESSGFRVKPPGGHHTAIRTLVLTLGTDKSIVNRFDKLRKKRNLGLYDRPGLISDREIEEMITIAGLLRTALLKWLSDSHPDLL